MEGEEIDFRATSAVMQNRDVPIIKVADHDENPSKVERKGNQTAVILIPSTNAISNDKFNRKHEANRFNGNEKYSARIGIDEPIVVLPPYQDYSTQNTYQDEETSAESSKSQMKVIYLLIITSKFLLNPHNFHNFSFYQIIFEKNHRY